MSKLKQFSNKLDVVFSKGRSMDWRSMLPHTHSEVLFLGDFGQE